MNIGNELGPVEGFANRIEHDAADFMRRLAHPHAATQAPAVQPVNLAVAAAAAPPKETEMPTLTDDLKADLTEGLAYAEGLVARLKTAAPGLITKVSGYEQSPIVQALEGALLPPEVEAAIAATISNLAAKYPAPVAAAPAQPAAPAPVQQ